MVPGLDLYYTSTDPARTVVSNLITADEDPDENCSNRSRSVPIYANKYLHFRTSAMSTRARLYRELSPTSLLYSSSLRDSSPKIGQNARAMYVYGDDRFARLITSALLRTFATQGTITHPPKFSIPEPAPLGTRHTTTPTHHLKPSTQLDKLRAWEASSPSKQYR